MNSTMEQWGLIIFVIWPIGFYCVLAIVNFIDRKRGSDV